MIDVRGGGINARLISGIPVHLTTGAEILNWLECRFACQKIKAFERLRMQRLAYLICGDEWTVRTSTQASKRTIERLWTSFLARGIDALHHNRRDRTPLEYQAAKQQIQVSVMNYHRPRLNAGDWERKFQAAGVPHPSTRTIRAWLQRYRSERRAKATAAGQRNTAAGSGWQAVQQLI